MAAKIFDNSTREKRNIFWSRFKFIMGHVFLAHLHQSLVAWIKFCLKIRDSWYPEICTVVPSLASYFELFWTTQPFSNTESKDLMAVWLSENMFTRTLHLSHSATSMISRISVWYTLQWSGSLLTIDNYKYFE